MLLGGLGELARRYATVLVEVLNADEFVDHVVEHSFHARRVVDAHLFGQEDTCL